MKYEVYVGRIGEDVVYVGEGLIGRHQHLNSGVSHVYEANKAHFSHTHIDVEIRFLCSSKEDAREKEGVLISQLRPKWNRVMASNSDFKKEVGKYIKYLNKNSRLKRLLEVLYPRLCADTEYTITSREYLERTGDKMSILYSQYVAGERRLHAVIEDFYKIKNGLYYVKFKDGFYENPSAYLRSGMPPKT